MKPSLIWMAALGGAIIFGGVPIARGATVVFTVREADSSEPVPCRIHLKNPAGEPVFPRGLPKWNDHFVCPGTVTLDLPPGIYPYEVERGPEYRRVSGALVASESETVAANETLERLVDLRKEGWWSGDLHIHRAVEEMPLLMRAEDLDIGPVITWWNNRNIWRDRPIPEDPLVRVKGPRFFRIMAGEDEREGGALMFFNLDRPVDITGSSREFPSPMKFLRAVKEQDHAWVDIEKPFWWDVPVWLACGPVDSIGLANNHMCRNSMYEDEAWGRPRDTNRLPNPRGNGFWSQEIYYHILNSGLRLPPSAGSASGVLPNPVGYNRVYVQVGSEPDYASWWENLRRGRCWVTNGPILRVQANDSPPGTVFHGDGNSPLNVQLHADLILQDPATHLDIIQNGAVVRQIPITPDQTAYDLGSLALRESGWFLVRVICDVPETFRFASTAPFYVEMPESPRRVSRRSAAFFLDWVRERRNRIHLDNPNQREPVLKWHRLAEDFWRQKLAEANAE